MTQTQHPDQAGAELAETPRRAPFTFRPAELLPPRRWYVWMLSAVAVALIALGLAATGFRTDLGDDSPSAVPEAGTLQISGTDMTKTIPCHAGYLSVSGKKNTITLVGHCASVSVSGSGNRITVDSADALSTSGTGNVVVYHWGSPRIVDAGTASLVRQG